MHLPVLLKETIKFLEPKPNENFIDATFGEGGLSLELVKYIRPEGKILAFEWDQELYRQGLNKLRKMNEKNIKLVNKNFREIKKVVKKEKFTSIRGIVFDLGISSWHYEKSGRGFSFRKDEPLDMRINPKEIKITAFEIINYASFKELVEIFENYGEEREARKIAKAIIDQRRIKKIETSKELAELIAKVKRKRGKLHPATQVFLALRTFINNEYQNLEEGLKNAFEVLESGGRMIIISFQGIENRLIKKFIKEVKGRVEILTKKTVKPQPEEVKLNPRSRSANLRAIKKL